MTVKTLEIKVNRVFKLETEGPVKGFADIAVNEVLIIKGLRVVEGKKGLFVTMPKSQGKDNKWYDSVYPLTKEARQDIQEAVLEAFNG